MASQDSSQSSSKQTGESKKVTFSDLYGEATIDPPPPPPRGKNRDKQPNNPPASS